MLIDFSDCLQTNVYVNAILTIVMGLLYPSRLLVDCLVSRYAIQVIRIRMFDG